MRWMKTLFWMVVFLIAILFSIQNKDLVTVRFGLSPIQNAQWFEVPGVPLFLVVLCAIFLGVFLGGVGDLYRHLQLKRTLRKNKKTIERLERELHSFRGPGPEQPSLLKEDM